MIGSAYLRLCQWAGSLWQVFFGWAVLAHSRVYAAGARDYCQQDCEAVGGPDHCCCLGDCDCGGWECCYVCAPTPDLAHA